LLLNIKYIITIFIIILILLSILRIDLPTHVGYVRTVFQFLIKNEFARVVYKIDNNITITHKRNKINKKNFHVLVCFFKLF